MLQIIPHSHLKTPQKPPFYKLNNAKKTTPHNRKPVFSPNRHTAFYDYKVKKGERDAYPAHPTIEATSICHPHKKIYN